MCNLTTRIICYNALSGYVFYTLGLKINVNILNDKKVFLCTRDSSEIDPHTHFPAVPCFWL